MHMQSDPVLADKALNLAIDAAEKAHLRTEAGSLAEATEMALAHLRQSLVAVPATHKTKNELLRLYNDAEFTYH